VDGMEPSAVCTVNQWLNYSHRGAGYLNLKKKLESENEITIVGEYKYERQRFVNIATSFY